MEALLLHHLDPPSMHTMPSPKPSAVDVAHPLRTSSGKVTAGAAGACALAVNGVVYGAMSGAGMLAVGVFALAAGVAAGVALRPSQDAPVATGPSRSARPADPERASLIGVDLGDGVDDDDDSLVTSQTQAASAVLVFRATPEAHAALKRAVQWAPVPLEAVDRAAEGELVFACHSAELANAGPALMGHLHGRLGPLFDQIRVGVAVTPHDGSFADARMLAGVAAEHASAGEAAWHDDLSRKLFGCGPFQAGDLTAALEDGQIVMAFQPFYTNDRWTLAGAEILIRWRHPQCGELPPSRFLSAFRGKHDLVTLTQEVVTVACRKLSTWKAAFGDGFRVVVNSGLAEFCDPSTFGSLAYLLDLAGADRVRFDIPVDELLHMTDEEREMLTSAADEGAQLIATSVRDIAQLDALRGLPVSGVKIDAYRLGALGVTQIEPLARAAVERGLQVYAVRVESAADLQRLRNLDTLAYVQGFALSQVVDAATIDRLGSPFAQVTIDPKASRPVVEARAAVELHL